MELQANDDENNMKDETWLRIKNNDPTLKKLSIIQQDVENVDDANPSDWTVLGEDIGKNDKLEEVSIRAAPLRGFDVDISYFHAANKCLLGFFDGMAPNETVKTLTLDLNERRAAYEVAIHKFTPFVLNNQSLQQLNLTFRDSAYVYNDWLLEVLEKRSHSLNGIRLLYTRRNEWDDGINSKLKQIFGVLDRNARLSIRTIDLSNNGIWWTGCYDIATHLKNPDCTVREIDLSQNSIDDNAVFRLSRALAVNKSLQVLILQSNPGITDRSWKRLTNRLCNTSSINATHLSNHTLRRITNDENERASLPENLASLLEINEHEDKGYVTWKKIVQNHFSVGFDAESYVGADTMPLHHVPDILSYLGRYNDSEGLTAIYSLVRITSGGIVS